MTPFNSTSFAGLHPGLGKLRVGLDIVQISRIGESLASFGERFTKRLFTDDEIRYSEQCVGQTAERLAARFAAKEAAIKAFSFSDAGINWRDIEVCKQPDGACHLTLHGKAAALAAQLGVFDVALSLSHDGDYASAVVTALCDTDSLTSTPETP